VTATKAARGTTPSITSPTTTITFTTPSSHRPVPSSVVLFSATSGTLDAAATKVLNSFAAKLTAGNSVLVTGYAYNDSALAKRRAAVVAAYLTRRIKAKFNLDIKTITVMRLHEVSLRRE
jgi:hypothetical protein